MAITTRGAAEGTRPLNGDRSVWPDPTPSCAVFGAKGEERCRAANHAARRWPMARQAWAFPRCHPRRVIQPPFPVQALAEADCSRRLRHAAWGVGEMGSVGRMETFFFTVGVILAHELTFDTLPEPRLGSTPH
jgi:hypothetical protein